MKYKYKNNIVALTVALVLLVAYTACSDMEKNWNADLVTYPEMTITDFAPKSARPGTTVTITGTNFGDRSEAAEVLFNGTESTVFASYSDNTMVVEVPEGASSGPMAVKVWYYSKTFDTDFTFIPGHSIAATNAMSGAPGDEIIIAGTNFGNDASQVTVRFGNIEAEIISISNTEIIVKVPEAEAGSYYITVEIDGQVARGPNFFVGGEKLIGTIIGHSGSYNDNPATTIGAALDGDISTYIDAKTNPGYVGYDFSEQYAANVTSVRYYPRSTHASRMQNCEIRGSNSDSYLTDYVMLHKITEVPQVAWGEARIQTTESYRYIYYYAEAGNCNVAEVEVYGNLIKQELPVGRLIWEFNTDSDNEGWAPQNNAAWVVEDGLMKVVFSQTSGNKRADFKQVNTPVVIHTGNYPIVAIKFTKPEGARVTFDTDLGSVQNGYNKYYTNYVDKDVYYYDLSVQSIGSGGTVYSNQELSLTTFQFKIADIPQTDPATGYEVSWIRTFSSVAELATFIGN